MRRKAGARAVGEDVHEEAAIGREPWPSPRHQFAPAHDVLEHFNRHDAVELPFAAKHPLTALGVIDL